MTAPALILPNRAKGAPRWSTPQYIGKIFEWNGQADAFRVTDEAPPPHETRPVYALNLNNQYRVDKALAESQSPGNHCVYEALDPAIWQAVVKCDGILLLDMAIEMLFCRQEIADGLVNGIKTSGLDPSRVFLINQNLWAKEKFDRLFPDHMAAAPRILALDSGFWLLAGHNKATPDNQDELRHFHHQIRDNRHRDRQHKFISFNGRARPHRFYILIWLYTHGFLDMGAVSFLGYGAKGKDILQTVRNQLTWLGHTEAEMVLEHLDRFAEMLPMSVDISLEESQQSAAYKISMPWSGQPREMVTDAWFSIVTDTVFDTDGDMFVTEKAYKPFMNFSPFIYFGHAGALQRMRELGFRTFAPMIDETYDQEPDRHRRMDMALAECKRLAEMSQADLKALYDALWPVLEHNYLYFYFDVQKTAGAAFRQGLLDPMGL